MKVIIDGIQYVPQPEPPKDKSLLSALEIRFNSDAGENITIRDYLRRLLEAVWVEEECFSGKRPFGNSGWKWEVFMALAKAGFVEATFDPEKKSGCDMTAEQRKKADDYVRLLIIAAFYGVQDV